MLRKSMLVGVGVLVLVVLVSAMSLAASVQLIKEDRDTAGLWKGTYGSQGYYIPYAYSPEDLGLEEVEGEEAPEHLDVVRLPDYLESCEIVFSELSGRFLWEMLFPGDPLALEPADEYEGRMVRFVPCIWEYHTEDEEAGVNINIVPKTNNPYQVALFMSDYDAGNRIQNVRVYDLDTGELLDDHTGVVEFAEGLYLVWKVQGSIRIEVGLFHGETTYKIVNAVFSAVFFD